MTEVNKMSHRWLRKHPRIERDDELISEKCIQCKIGRKQLENYKAFKQTKTVSRRRFIKVSIENSFHCGPCIYNGITGNKARIDALAIKNFQSLDLFEPIEGE
jgi:hypothetical protein